MRLKSQMYPHQNKCVNLILENSHFGLFLDMGLGKTAACLTAVDELMYFNFSIAKVLVIATKRVVESTWMQEAAKWGHLQHLEFSLIAGNEKKRIEALKKSADIYLISRDSIAWLCDLYGGKKLPFDMLIVDESSSFKNHGSLRFKALKKVQAFLDRVVILTGTPAPQGVANLWPQIYLLDRGERLGRTISIFRENYLYVKNSSGHIVYEYGCTEKSRNLIMDKISDVVISMDQKDYLKIPEFSENEVLITMPKSLMKAYKEFEKEKVLELFGNGENITAANSAALSNKLLQFANGAVYDEEKNVHEVHNLKLDVLEEMVEEAQGNPMIVAYTYKSDVQRIMERLKRFNPVQMKGDNDVRKWNKGEIAVMLMHPASGGHGLNLQEGGHLITWYGNTWDLELLQQLNHRLKRPGQKSSVVISKLIIKGTIDERVVAAQKSKDRVQKAITEAVKYSINQYIKK